MSSFLLLRRISGHIPSIRTLSAVASVGCCQASKPRPKTLITQRPDLDFDYLLDPENIPIIEENIRNRKGIGNIRKLHETWAKIEEFQLDPTQGPSEERFTQLWDELYEYALAIPNKSHPDAPIGDESKAKIVEEVPSAVTKGLEKAKTAEEIAQGWKSVIYPRRSAGGRSYSLIGATANLETALLSFAKNTIREYGFKEVNVSDILPKTVTQSCGLPIESADEVHPIQYTLTDFPNMCLSGTAEMGIADTLANRTFHHSELPALFLAESRCFRPEISKSAAEAKLYRVHEFNKVEMFAVTTPEDSDAILQKFVNIQTTLWRTLGIGYRLLDMPSEELGASAMRKYDVEAWMPGRNLYGEVSSTSNCGDFQSRRLGIRYTDSSGEEHYAHTCNGTAIASTRAMIAVLETFQKAGKGFVPPACLTQYLPKKRQNDKLKIVRL
uniref:serine--tRNA ligase n=1 Tax=Panagrellus redivivus TaxID=6233 RepID=A0A7E4VNR6_PANRE